MTFAWYGHLKFPHMALWLVILVSWGIALAEYCFAVPANRIGAGHYSLMELKTLQEVITIVVFVLVAALFFDQKITIQHVIGLSFIAFGAAIVFSATANAPFWNK